MTTKKIITFAIAGVAVAAVVCLIVGLCYYFPALNFHPLTTDPNYKELVESRASAMQLGMLVIIVGCSFLIMSLMAFIGMLAASKFLSNR